MFLIEYFFILPPEENARSLHLDFFAFCKTVRASLEFPETLVVIISVLESTVFGRRYPFTTLTWMSFFDRIDEITSPIVPDPPTPANTMWSIFLNCIFDNLVEK